MQFQLRPHPQVIREQHSYFAPKRGGVVAISKVVMTDMTPGWFFLAPGQDRDNRIVRYLPLEDFGKTPRHLNAALPI
jgi:hypothetical protein